MNWEHPSLGERFIMNRKMEHMDNPTEKLLQDLKQVVHDGEEVLRAGVHELGEKGAEARERLATALENAKETGRRLQVHALNGAKATDKVIREHPYQSLGVAFGIGILIGVLVARK
jgi:ElaB/YqjD/DUF883 family membrane-anchored ribosome-binding protein